MTSARTEAQLAFLIAADRLKALSRPTALTDASRRERAGEQAWHQALWALVFAPDLAVRGADPDRSIAALLAAPLLEDAPRALSLLPEDQARQVAALAPAPSLGLAQPLFQELFTPGLAPADRDRLTAGLTLGPAAALADDWPALHARATALLDRRPPPPDPVLDRRLSFLIEADRLKTVTRATPLNDGSRRETSAEHSWHIALHALILAEHALVPADPARVARMLLIHDLVEIDVGDVPIHAAEGQAHGSAATAAAEAAAARRLFGLLPEDEGAALLRLWEEFEAAETPDAVFAKSVDRVQPVIANLESGGGSWTDYAVTRDALDARVGVKVRRGAPALWSALLPRIDAWFGARA